MCQTLRAVCSKIDREVPDPRRTSHGHILHKLSTIIVLGLLATICGCRSYTRIEFFGRQVRNWLARHIDLSNGIPDSDTIRRVFERVDPQKLSKCITDFVCALVQMSKEEKKGISFDGKTIRGSASDDHKPYHILSAYCQNNHIVLGDVCLADKCNEITSFHDLVKIVDIEGAVVTGDAMFCNRKIAGKIKEKGGDYVLCVKENQPSLLDEMQSHMESADNCQECTTTDKGHGRIEVREYKMSTNIDSYENRGDWPKLSAFCQITSTVTDAKTGETVVSKRFYITSLNDVNEFSKFSRAHWSIENNLHWNLDNCFKEDACKVKKGNAPTNLNIIRKASLFFVQTAKNICPVHGITKPLIMDMCKGSTFTLGKVLDRVPFLN